MFGPGRERQCREKSLAMGRRHKASALRERAARTPRGARRPSDIFRFNPQSFERSPTKNVRPGSKKP